MDKEKFKEKQEKRIKQVESMIETVEKSSSMRFIFDDKEMLHGFDMAGDIYKTMQTVKAAVIAEFRADIEGMKKAVEYYDNKE